MGLYGSTPSPPDYGPIAAASEEAARIAAELGREQLDFSKMQYNQMFPLIEDIAGTQTDAMRQQMEMASELNQRQKDVFNPVEDKFVENAMKYNTGAERERMARQAAADAGQAFNQTRAMNERAMASMGVNPNSGRFAGMNRASELGLAAQRANAMTGTRERAKLQGQAMLADAAGLNRGLVGLSQNSTAMALNAGNSAVGNYQSPGQQYLNGMQGGANTILQGRQLQMQGLGNILNSQTSIYNTGLNNQGSWIEGLAGISMAAGSMGFNPFGSSKDYKTKTGDVDAKQVSKDVEQLAIDQWQYKPGIEDGGKHIGPYAEDMDKLGAGAKGGKAIDIISAMGLNLAASKGLSERVSALEKKQGKKREKANV